MLCVRPLEQTFVAMPQLSRHMSGLAYQDVVSHILAGVIGNPPVVVDHHVRVVHRHCHHAWSHACGPVDKEELNQVRPHDVLRAEGCDLRLSQLRRNLDRFGISGMPEPVAIEKHRVDIVSPWCHAGIECCWELRPLELLAKMKVLVRGEGRQQPPCPMPNAVEAVVQDKILGITDVKAVPGRLHFNDSCEAGLHVWPCDGQRGMSLQG
mmetsp:Transcript_63080/g.137066  ORF Transcript_63080/g.137066 Transcript_63080/m.137066 type:complete len:209 (-) Transcript_63080:694-1320(-)